MTRTYLYTLEAGALMTHSFHLGGPISEYLQHRHAATTDVFDLQYAELALRQLVNDTRVLATQYHAMFSGPDVSVDRDLPEESDFDCLKAVQNGEATALERRLSVYFHALVSMASGIEDRIVKLTIRVNDLSGGRVWPSASNCPRGYDKFAFTRQKLREEPEVDATTLREITENRNRSIHERHYFAHLVEEDGQVDIIFSPAINEEELSRKGFPSYRLSLLAGDVKWLIDSYLVWWCQKTVSQISLTK